MYEIFVRRPYWKHNIKKVWKRKTKPVNPGRDASRVQKENERKKAPVGPTHVLAGSSLALVRSIGLNPRARRRIQVEKHESQENNIKAPKHNTQEDGCSQSVSPYTIWKRTWP